MCAENECFADIVQQDEFTQSRGTLPFILGHDDAGSMVVKDLDDICHILIAGATGTGKSNLVHSILLSLMQKCSPDKCKFLLCDTKIAEFSGYKDSRYLLAPVAADTWKISAYLQWCVTEMTRRLKTFSEDHSRTLAAYNDTVWENFADLPYIIVVLDDVSQIVADKENVNAIHRLLQNGRSAGIYLLMVAQSPSSKGMRQIVNMLTPARAVFNLFSADDEKLLLGSSKNKTITTIGEMTFSENSTQKRQNIRCYQVSNSDISSIVSKTIDLSVPSTVDFHDILPEPAPEPESTFQTKEEAPEYDEMLPQAVDVVLETGQASVSVLQRRLKLGYARSARIIDQMQKLGYIGPFQGSKTRTIFITQKDWTKQRNVDNYRLDLEIIDVEDIESPTTDDNSSTGEYCSHEDNAADSVSALASSESDDKDIQTVVMSTKLDNGVKADSITKERTESIVIRAIKKHFLFCGAFLGYHIIFSNFFPIDKDTNTLIAPEWYVWVGIAFSLVITFRSELKKLWKRIQKSQISKFNS